LLVCVSSLSFPFNSLLPDNHARLAVKIMYLSGGSGLKLIVMYTALSSCITLFTSNDICIMTLTPIISYCAKVSNVDSTPFVVAQFVVANIWSMALFIGNP
jgi:arsenical pump membrane protein